MEEFHTLLMEIDWEITIKFKEIEKLPVENPNNNSSMCYFIDLTAKEYELIKNWKPEQEVNKLKSSLSSSFKESNEIETEQKGKKNKKIKFEFFDTSPYNKKEKSSSLEDEIHSQVEESFQRKPLLKRSTSSEEEQ